MKKSLEVLLLSKICRVPEIFINRLKNEKRSDKFKFIRKRVFLRTVSKMTIISLVSRLSTFSIHNSILLLEQPIFHFDRHVTNEISCN